MIYSVKIPGTGQNPGYVYGAVDVIPATSIYYEDNFICYTDGSKNNDETGVWEVVGEEDDNVQKTDRPGVSQVLDDANNLYGYDEAYKYDNLYSNGSSHHVVVKTGDQPTATFTFTGTGFDLISLTGGETRTVLVRLYKGTEIGKNLYKTWTADTFYGYEWKDGKWEINQNAENALYQIPVVRCEDIDYGTYTVEIMPRYSSVFDNKEEGGSYDFYLDAVRVYSPADETGEDYQVVEDAYKADRENKPQYKEIRDIILESGSLESGIENNGIVYIDGNGESSLEEFEKHGPKHEVYLNATNSKTKKAGQLLAFYLSADSRPDSVQIAVKSVEGSTPKMKVACMVEENGTWKPYKNTQTEVIQTSTDMYVDISDQCIWEQQEDGTYKTIYPIVIQNTGDELVDQDNLLSLTKLKWTGVTAQGGGEEMPVTLSAFANEKAVAAAFALMKMGEEKTITIHYQDRDGNALGEDVNFKVEAGKSYDVSEYVEKAIKGYEKVETSGDPVKGTADSDKTIIVIYEKEKPEEVINTYEIRITYVDENGNLLADAYIQKGVKEGVTYDMSSFVQKEIEGYKVSKVVGDDVQGIMDADKEITVIYVQEQEAETPPLVEPPKGDQSSDQKQDVKEPVQAGSQKEEKNL